MLQFHHRHAPAAARLHAFDVDHENLARPWKQCELSGERVPFIVLRTHLPPASIDPQDKRAAVYAAEHTRHAAVPGDVRVLFVPPSAELDIGDVGPGDTS